MLTFEAPLVRIRMGKGVRFTDQAPLPPMRPASTSARVLALAHHIVQAVERGEVRDFSEVARQMGVSQARVSMVVALTFLAPEIQAGVLLGTDRRISHKRLLAVSRIERWEEQLRALGALGGRQRDSGRKSRKRNPLPETGPILAPNALEIGSNTDQKGEMAVLYGVRDPAKAAS